MHTKDIGQHNWDPDTWTPLIIDKVLLSGLAHTPTDVMLKRCRQIDNRDIVRLEIAWKKDPT